MTRRFALTGSPLVGKSTLARHLRDTYNFMLADHSRTVVEAFVYDYNSYPPLDFLTVEAVYKDKEKWRPYLQAFSIASGFSDDDRALFWTKMTLAEWLTTSPAHDVVFDPFRGEVQAQVMRDLGFELVQIEITPELRCARARLLEYNCVELERAINAYPEIETGIKNPDITLNGALTVDELGRILMHRPENMHGYTIFGSHL